MVKPLLWTGVLRKVTAKVCFTRGASRIEHKQVSEHNDNQRQPERIAIKHVSLRSAFAIRGAQIVIVSNPPSVFSS